MKVTPLFRWYDIYIGAYIDLPGRAVYLVPLPMVVLKVSW